MNEELTRQIDQLYRQKQEARDAQIATATMAAGNLASSFIANIQRMINDFEKNLVNNKEIGMKLVSFGQNIIILVQAVSRSDPSLIRIIGTLENGSAVELIQHVSQQSFFTYDS